MNVQRWVRNGATATIYWGGSSISSHNDDDGADGSYNASPINDVADGNTANNDAISSLYSLSHSLYAGDDDGEPSEPIEYMDSGEHHDGVTSAESPDITLYGDADDAVAALVLMMVASLTATKSYSGEYAV